jgi:pilus assembly protein CpaB
MRPKSIALLLLALGCGLVASIGITEVMAKRNSDNAGPTGDIQSIFVATTDIGLGDLLTSAVLKFEPWPKEKIPSGAIFRLEDIEGRRARTTLYAGEPILDSRLLGKGASEQGATALIPKGYRVVPVKVDLVSGGSSLIVPGDRVDVMIHLVRDANRDIPETVTRTILQDIKVFAVDDVVDLEREKDSSRKIAAKTISLLVTPEQAAKVMLATQMGTINLVMRSPEDDKLIANAQARPGELLGNAVKSERPKEALFIPTEPEGQKSKGFLDFLGSMKAPPASAAENKPIQTWTMRVLKPGEVDEVQFENDNAHADAQSFAWKATTLATRSSPSQPASAPNKPALPVINDPKKAAAAPVADAALTTAVDPPSLTREELIQKQEDALRKGNL